MTLAKTLHSPEPRTAAKGEAEPSRRFDPAAQEPLTDLLRTLDADRYHFVTATPATHARVVARPDRQRASSIRDVLGWSLPFEREVLPDAIFDRLDAAGVLSKRDDGLFACSVRVSSVHDTLFLHSAFPTVDEFSVFLGPDSYRFADLIDACKEDLPRGATVLDYGAGAGVGGITAAQDLDDPHLTLADINPDALLLSSINAGFAGLRHASVKVESPADVQGTFDLIVTHPPFMMDSDGRAYRDGGDLYGGQLSLDWTLGLVPKLKQGGTFIMHTGVSIVDGQDVLLDRLERDLPSRGFDWDYHELDPDIFGDELDKPSYQKVERIAAVGLCVTRTG